MRKLPASFSTFWLESIFGSTVARKIEALTEFPETLYFRELDPSHPPQEAFFPPGLVGILMTDVGRKALSVEFSPTSNV